MHSNQLYLKFRGPKKGKFKLKCLSRLHATAGDWNTPRVGFFRQEPVHGLDYLSGGSEGELAHPPPREPC